MDEQIQRLWSRVNQEVLEKLHFSGVLFRDELGTQLNYLKDFQVQLAIGQTT